MIFAAENNDHLPDPLARGAAECQGRQQLLSVDRACWGARYAERRQPVFPKNDPLFDGAAPPPSSIRMTRRTVRSSPIPGQDAQL